jgi:hypothetical protein
MKHVQALNYHRPDKTERIAPTMDQSVVIGPDAESAPTRSTYHPIDIGVGKRDTDAERRGSRLPLPGVLDGSMRFTPWVFVIGVLGALGSLARVSFGTAFGPLLLYGGARSVRYGGARASSRRQRGVKLGLVGLTAATAVVFGGMAQASPACPSSAGITTCTFVYTGAEQTWTVPASVTSVTVTAAGAAGGNGFSSSAVGGTADTVSGTLSVTPGSILYVEVGGRGGAAAGNVAGSGGFNGGGNGLEMPCNCSSASGGGGGASDVRSASGSLSTRLIVAGGGGGGGAGVGPGSGGNAGGAGGSGFPGSDTSGAAGGGGGTSSAGGAGGAGGSGSPFGGGIGGTGGSGVLGIGGIGGASAPDGTFDTGGGAGGGRYGGGGGGGGHFGSGGGGGGGSDLVPASGTSGLASSAAQVTISYTVPAAADTTPPSCALTAVIAGPPKQLQITVQDSDGGLKTIATVSSSNATVSIPAFTVGTTSPVVVTATKIDQTLGASVTLQATDMAGNTITCDPEMVTVPGGPGRPVSKVVTGVAQAESTVSIYNSTPGLKQLNVTVNGKLFKVTHLHDGEVRSIDVAAGLKAGNNNAIVLTPRGSSGSAEVLISDMGKHTAAQHGTKHVVVDHQEQQESAPLD